MEIAGLILIECGLILLLMLKFSYLARIKRNMKIEKIFS